METLQDQEVPPLHALTWLSCYNLNVLDTAEILRDFVEPFSLLNHIET